MTGGDALHRTLRRQLRRLVLSPDAAPGPDEWGRLLAAVSATYQGADDDRYTLERSIEISSGEMRALHDELSEQARHDVLTGLPNRMALLEQLPGALAAARRHGGDVAVLFIDLDGFKAVNDHLGHAAGDELLIRSAERIRRVVRTEDVVSRLGGDEFVVLSSAPSGELDAARVGARIVEALESPFRIREQESFVSASVGIAVRGQDAITGEDLLRQADLAMYRAKERGRGLVVLFDDAMHAAAQERADLESALRCGIDRGELVLHYQPLVRLADGEIEGYEALVRWDRPGHGLIGPDTFIAVAERGPLILAIGRWVLHEACREAAGWADPTLRLAVNLGARELAQDGAVGCVSDALQRSGLAPSRLTIELTESTMLSDKESVTANVQRLRRLGVRTAIDDFGTGYSSLSHLREVPASSLKIDRSFICDLDRVSTAPAIVGAIVTMGHALGLDVVAEGVERPAQLELVRALGCDTAQGFLLGRPAPAGTLGAGAAPTAQPAR